MYEEFSAWLVDYAGVEDPADLDARYLDEVLTRFFSSLGWGNVSMERIGESGLAFDSGDWAEAEPAANALAPGCHVTAGLLAFSLTSSILPREKLSPNPSSDPWWLIVILVMGILLISVGIAAATIAILHLFWKPTLGQACERCGYLLQGLTCDKCPECGESVAQLGNQVEGK